MKPPERRKTAIFPIRLTAQEREIIGAAGGRKPSAWARRVLVNAALKATKKRKAGDSNPSA